MAGRTSQEAFRNYRDPLRASVGCVAHAPLSLERGLTARDLKIDTSYTLALNQMEPVRLRGDIPIVISLGLNFRIQQLEDEPTLFAALTVMYFYGLATLDGAEVLTFHWNPVATAVRFPHLHVGRAIVSGAQILPRTFHKVHVPTGFVTLGSVVRLAITEFGVRPLRADWQPILDEAEGAQTQ